jgi:hypothetical protein
LCVCVIYLNITTRKKYRRKEGRLVKGNGTKRREGDEGMKGRKGVRD